MSLRQPIILGLAGAVAATAVAAAPAAAKPALQCGQTVTVSTKLTRDLTGCSGAGLVVGAAGITIDLNGHAIRGVNAAGSVGVSDDGHARVTVEGRHDLRLLRQRRPPARGAAQRRARPARRPHRRRQRRG